MSNYECRIMKFNKVFHYFDHAYGVIRPARNAFGQIRDSTSMFISGPQLLFHSSVLCMAGGYSAVQKKYLQNR